MAGLKRRDALFLGGLVALAAGWQVFGVGRQQIEFTRISSLPGWRFASVGGSSGLSGDDFLTIGLDDTPDPLQPEQMDAVVHDVAQPGQVPVAVFSDFFCPYCRGLIGRLRGRTASPEIAVTWHELPLLGPASVIAAKGAVAAGLQDGYAEFYATLLSEGFKPSKTWFGRIADAAGLDGAQLMADMEAKVVTSKLDQSARAASTLGFSGTPGIVIGKDAVLGALDRDLMEDVILGNA
mgnify:CR=1 FL=1